MIRGMERIKKTAALVLAGCLVVLSAPVLSDSGKVSAATTTDYIEQLARPAASYSYATETESSPPQGLNDGRMGSNVEPATRWASYSEDRVVANPWVMYTWDKSYTISELDISWYDDGGGCLLPDSFTVQYHNLETGDYEDLMTDVTKMTNNKDRYGYDTYSLPASVTTDRLRIHMKNSVSKKAVAIMEWRVRGVEAPSKGRIEQLAAANASWSYVGSPASGLNDGRMGNYLEETTRWSSYSLDRVVADPWVEYAWNKAYAISQIEISWYDDGDGCLLPDSFTVQYRNLETGDYEDLMTDVTKMTNNKDLYGYDTYFLPSSVTTDKLRIQMKNSASNKAAAIMEWRVRGVEAPSKGCIEQLATANALWSYVGSPASGLNDGRMGNYLEEETRWSSYSLDQVVANPWVEYVWDKNYVISQIEISWYDDDGGCLLPDSFTVQYYNLETGAYEDLLTDVTKMTNNKDIYGYDTYPLPASVTTNKLRINMKNSVSNKGVAIMEWRVRGARASSEGGIETLAATDASYSYDSSPASGLNDGRMGDYKESDTRWSSYKNESEVEPNPWVEYTWDKDYAISQIKISWYDDGGGCLLPDSFTVQYWDRASKSYKNVPGAIDLTNLTNNKDIYGFDTYTFPKITTDTLRLNIKNAVSGKAVAIMEWQVKGEEAVTAATTDSAITKGDSGSIIALLNGNSDYGSSNTLIRTERAVDDKTTLVYQDGSNEYQLYYSSLHNAYFGLAPKTLTDADVKANITAKSSETGVPSIRFGFIGENRDTRTEIGFDDLYFFDKTVLVDGTVPSDGIEHVLAMDVNADLKLTPRDLTSLIQKYVFNTPFAPEASSNGN